MEQNLSCLEKLKQARVAAIKDKNIELSSLFAYILSAAQATAKATKKEIDDNEILQLIKTEIKSLKSNFSGIKEKVDGVETGVVFNLPEEKLKEFQVKIDSLEKLLPKQLSETELRDIIEKLVKVDGLNNMGLVQKHLKTNYLGLYNGGDVAKILAKI